MRRHIHFIGAGGIGVSGIAQLALKSGERVSGCDGKESEMTRRLSALGADIRIGHDPAHLTGVDLLVHSSAIGHDNPEMAAARARRIPVKKRAEFLSELMAGKEVVAVTGAHGKTTTSSLAAELLLGCGFSPTVVVGGILRADGDNAKLGESRYFVAEADESDGTFLCYRPTYSIVTNIDHEHLDHYKTYDNLLDAFSTFIRSTKPRGAVFYCAEDDALSALVKKSGVRAVSFGFSQDADFYPRDIVLGPGRIAFTCFKKATKLGALSLGLVGRHNVLNVLAVVALGDELGLDFPKIERALGGFRGVERRFQVKYEDSDIVIVDDYAHHPTEIAATIDAARSYGRMRLVVVFQPHRYTRTKNLFEKFPGSFAKSDYLVVTDIYAAGEDPIEGVAAFRLAEAVKRQADIPVDYVKRENVSAHLRSRIRAGDLVLFLGAGDITKVSDEFARSFKKKI